MPVEFEQLRDRATPWMGPLPPGLDFAAAKFEPPYQTAANEIAKLDTPSGGAVDWKKVQALCEDLLRTRTKDLLVACWLAHALHRQRALDGLTTGATLLSELIDKLWDTLQPDVKRLRGRVNALQWFLDKTVLILPEKDPASAELPKLEAGEAAWRHLTEVVRARFAASAPAMSPVQEKLERLRALAAEAVAREAPPPPKPAEPAPGPAVAPVAAAPAIAAPALGELGAAADATDFLRTVGSALISAAATLRRADAADPASYRLLRCGMWLHISAPPPATAGRTAVPPLPAPLKAQLTALAQNQKWAALLEETESAAPLQRFALELHRLSWQALQGLGHEKAKAALVTEVRSLLARVPQLAQLAFADGTPLADPETKAWLEAEVDKREAAPRQGDGVDEAALAKQAEARKLFADSQPAQALGLLHQLVATAKGGRERFRARLELARAALGAGLTALAYATFEELEREAAAHDLDGWEPALVSDCLKGLISATRALANDPRAAKADLSVPYRRLCRVDPAAAHEVWP